MAYGVCFNPSLSGAPNKFHKIGFRLCFRFLKKLVLSVDFPKCWFNNIDVSLLMTCQWLSLVHWPTVLFILIKVQDFHQSSQKFQCSVFIINQVFHQSSQNVGFKCWFKKMSNSQNIGFKGWFLKMSSFQNNGFLKMFKSISMALRPGLHLVQEGLAKEECPKEHFKKSIIQSSLWF